MGVPSLSPMMEAPENGDERPNGGIDRKLKNEMAASSTSEFDRRQNPTVKHNVRDGETTGQKEEEVKSECESRDAFVKKNDSTGRLGSGTSPSTSVQKDQNFFSKSFVSGEKTTKTLNSATNCSSPDPVEKSDRPKSNIRTIQNELPQRTFTSNVNKRKQSGDPDESSEIHSDVRWIPSKCSESKSEERGKPIDSGASASTTFPFLGGNVSPKPTSKSPSPKFKKNISNSLKKFTDISSPFKLGVGIKSEKVEKEERTPAKEEKTNDNMKEGENRTVESKTVESTQPNFENQIKVTSKHVHSKFGDLFNVNSPKKSPSTVESKSQYEPGTEGGKSGFFLISTSPTKVNGAGQEATSEVDGDGDKKGDDRTENINDQLIGSATTNDSHDNGGVDDDGGGGGGNIQLGKPNNKRKKPRNERKSICGDSPIKLHGANENVGNRKTKNIYYELSGGGSVDDKLVVGGRRNRKYSVLSTDGSIKNFVSENSEEFKKTNESFNKENINKKKVGGNRKTCECPQRHRRVSIIQGESLRHFIFEEPDTSRIKPNKQRKIDTTRNILLEDNAYKRKSSLISGDTLRNLLGEDGARKAFIGPDDKPRKFSINTLGDIVSARKFSLLPPGEIYTSQIDGKTTEIIKLAPGTKGRPLATIVVQQASIQRGSISGPSNQKEDSLLDVANTFTLEELHEFDMKYGSPHHCRSQSVKTPGRSCGRPNYLCLPQQRSRVASMPNTGVEEEYYRLRHFSITGKGVVNRGDSLKSRRSRSNNSVASSNSSHSTEHLPSNVGTVGSYPGSAKTSAECSLASSRESSTCSVPYKVVMLGSAGVGKSSLISQFMTSEYLHAYDTSLDEEFGEKSVSVLLDNEESELIFVDHPSSEMSPENCITTYQPQAYIIVYSVVDRSSFQIAEETLQSLWKTDSIGSKAVILVGNKTDLVRSRTISPEEGKNMATSYDCKFIETSVGINYNVDELLVGILTQIRLKLQQAAKPKRNKSPLGICIKKEGDSPKKWRKGRLAASLKVKGLLGRVWARDSRSKSCENLHVL